MEDTAVKHIDPVCGMTVDPARAAGFHDHDGSRYHFCGKGCLAKFVADPVRYLRAAEPSQVSTPIEVPPAAGTNYVCPMDPEVRQTRPRSVPEVRDGARARPGERTCDASRVHLPDAPGDRARRAGQLPDLRDGARAAHDHARRRAESRARRHDAPVLGRRWR